jgi:hypothetical protein
MRKLLGAAIIMCMLTVLTGAAESTIPKDVLEKHLKKLAALVPSGWTVRADADGTGIWIERKVSVHMESTAPNQGGLDPTASPQMGKPTLFLRFSPARTQADLAAMKKHNADREKVLQMLVTQMADIPKRTEGMMGWGEEDGYRPTTPEQQARLEAYLAVKKAMPELELPELFADDATFNWTHFYLQPADEDIQAEQERIKMIVESAFSRKPLH